MQLQAPSTIRPLIRSLPRLREQVGRMLLLALAALALAGEGVSPAEARVGELNVIQDRRYDEQTYLETHNAYAIARPQLVSPWTLDRAYLRPVANQDRSLTEQLDGGVRWINLDLWLLRQQPVAFVGNPFLEVWAYQLYTDGSTDGFYHPDSSWKNIRPEVVVGHDIRQNGYALTGAKPFRTLYSCLAEIRAWMDRTENRNEVVTLSFESNIPPLNRIFPVRDLCLLFGMDRIFQTMARPSDSSYPPYFTNTGVMFQSAGASAPPELWEVQKHGWPLIRDMVRANRRLVIFSSRHEDGFGAEGSLCVNKSPDGDQKLFPHTPQSSTN